MPSPRRNLVLFGPPASGKSSLARAVAALASCPCVDMDDDIVRAAARPVSALFADGSFRAAEAAACRRISRIPPPVVIAAGGGAHLSPANLAALARSSVFVTLSLSPRRLFRRILLDPSPRPLLPRSSLPLLRRRLFALLSARAASYRALPNRFPASAPLRILAPRLLALWSRLSAEAAP